MATSKLHILVYRNRNKTRCFNESLKFAHCLNIPDDIRGFDVLLTVHLSIILVINQLDAQNLVL